MTLRNTPHDFRIVTADMQASSSTPQGVIDITSLIIEVVIYESLDRSALTGTLVLADGTGIYQAANFKGVERVKLGFQLPDDDAVTIYRTFYIDKVISNNRANDESSVITLHLVEEIGYLSEYVNVNRSLSSSSSTGVGTEIITKLFQDYFDRDIEVRGNASASTTGRYPEQTPPLKVIVPNWTPLETAEWIRNRMVDNFGSPYYLYSGFTGGNIHLQSLMDILNYNIHYSKPFKFSQVSTNTNTTDMNEQMFIIENYSDTEGLNMLRINEEGFVNGKFMFHDVNYNYTIIPSHGTPTVNRGANSTTPSGDHWTAYGLMNSVTSQETPAGIITSRGAAESLEHIYPAKAVLPWESPSGDTEAAIDGDAARVGLSTPGGTARSSVEAIHYRPESRVIAASVFSSQQFGTNYRSYTEGRNEEDALRIVDSQALRHWIIGDPIQITVPGRLFLMADVNGRVTQTSVGNLIDLSFIASNGDKPKQDTKRSGRHMIYAAKHVFSPLDGYRVHATCVKVVANQDGVE